MKKLIQELLTQSLNQLQQENILPQGLSYNLNIEKTRSQEHGDLACNIAMVLAKPYRKKPRELAEEIVKRVPSHPLVKNIVIAGPGFINFYLSHQAYTEIIPEILKQKTAYGRNCQAKPKSINIEFVSSNPTGPLHVGHGRGAAYGSVLANILEAVGHKIHREYYINDAGRQMDIIAVSVWLRYLELFKIDFDFPSNGYKGIYVKDIAIKLKDTFDNSLLHPAEVIFNDIPQDEDENKPGQGDKEAHIDAIIQKAKLLLGHDQYQQVFQITLKNIIEDIKEDLAQFGVTYQEWFSEASLNHSGAISKALETLKKNHHTYEKDGALWFHSTALGDDKDRVLVRENGQNTYFASDVAYLLNKHERGFDEFIYIVGADHHGYIPRIKAAAIAMNIPVEKVNFILVQFAVLYRGEERVPMSTRGGNYVTLRELRDEIGKDAARFYYVMRKSDQHMDFDLELAKSQSKHNPVYYLQYAHARICSVFQQLVEKGGQYQSDLGFKNLDLLTIDREKQLMASLYAYPEVLAHAARDYEPHQIINYLIELSQDFHAYYNDNIILGEDELLKQARLCLIDSVRQVIQNALHILGISAPERL